MTQYHLRRSEKEISKNEELTAVLKRCKWATLALASGNRPYAVAINYGYDAVNHCLYMHCAESGHKIDVITNNNACCASIVEDLGYKDGDCDHMFRSLVIHGTITYVTDPQEIRDALKTMIYHLEPEPETVMKRFYPTGKENHKVGILRLDIRHITGKESL